MPSADRTEAGQFRSHLETMDALRQISDFTASSIRQLENRMRSDEELRDLDPTQTALDIVSKQSALLLSRFDLQALAKSARQLETGADYARRILRRYREEIPAEHQEQVVGTLVHGYPSHSFLIDLEECVEIGIPARSAAGEESKLMERIAVALHRFEPSDAILGLTLPTRVPGDTPTACETSLTAELAL